MGAVDDSGGNEGLTTSCCNFKKASRFEADGDRRFNSGTALIADHVIQTSEGHAPDAHYCPFLIR